MLGKIRKCLLYLKEVANYINYIQATSFFYKRQFYKQHQAETGKGSRKK